MDTLPREVLDLVLDGASKKVKMGYFFKRIYDTEDYCTYKDEELYSTPKEVVEAILDEAQEHAWEIACDQRDETTEHITPVIDEKPYKEILDDIMKQLGHCGDALAVCKRIKELLQDYDETCDMEIDIAFTIKY